MQLIIPQSIYSAIFALTLDEELQKHTSVKPSSLISQELETHDDAIGIMPSCDLYKHKNLFVSRKGGISFDGILSNTYIYFPPEQEKFTNLFLRGDVSTNEIILSSILFTERYNTEVKVNLDTDVPNFSERNYIVVGNENLDYEPFERGMSFADQVAALIDAPYVNFVFASQNKSLLEEFNENFKDLDRKIEDNIVDYLERIQLNELVRQKMISGLGAVYYEMTNIEIEGLTELIRLPFYRGIFKDVFELKLV